MHCCYEATMTEQAEVTQISIWKAYETQFQEIWKPNTEELSIITINHFCLLWSLLKMLRKHFLMLKLKVVALPQAPGEENQAPKKSLLSKEFSPDNFQ